MKSNNDLDYSYVFSDEEESVGTVDSEQKQEYEFEGYDVEINEKIALLPLKNI
ncbi:MAG: hypothetical protein KG003_02130 [Bacteroidetes bacterium]|nr:hypothetical protein [Bacteroidota bacterium]